MIGSSKMISFAFTLLLVALTAVTTKADWGCHSNSNEACDCSEAVCSETACTATGGTWTPRCQSCGCMCDGGQDTKTFTAKVDLFAGTLGYYSFDECPDLPFNPTIKMQVGQTYTFDQAHETNYYHPLGFAYYADGAHDEQDELEPGIQPPESGSTCNDTNVCPAPQYYIDGTYVGVYDNAVNGTTVIPSENFGLDAYEPKFFYPLGDWITKTYTVKLKFNVDTYLNDIFYFCHIHQGMTGRIVLTQANDATTLVNANERLPIIPYQADSIDPFDKACGAVMIEPFQPVVQNKYECPEKFVCGSSDKTANTQQFAQCIDAINCAMTVGMTTTAQSIPDLFLAQMIPHHENAVNMAKSLMYLELADSCTGKANLGDEENKACILKSLSLDIINNQNFQIQLMKGLYSSDYAEYEDDCAVEVRPSPDSDSGSAGEQAVCFSAFTTAFVNGKGSTAMDLIEVGDEVLTGSGEFQVVYSLDHRDMDKSTKFLQIAVGSDQTVLEITPKHMIFEEGKQHPVASGTISVGDKVATPNGYQPVTSIRMVERKGVFNPLTADGTIVAGGVVASTFSVMLDENEMIEISGHPVMSYQRFFTSLLKPYRFFCTTLSLELCRAESEKVLASKLASRVFFFHNGEDSLYKKSLLSFVASVLSLMEVIVLPLLYVSIPVAILKLAGAGKK